MKDNLTSLENVVAWLGNSTSNDNGLLTRLIAYASRFTLTHLQRPSLFQHACSEVYDGAGRGRQMLRQWPVLSVSSLTVGTQTIPAASSYGQPGYRLEPWDGMPPGQPQALDLTGYAFYPGCGNVAVSYLAGYVVQDEAQTIPAAPHQITVDAPYGNWAVDEGVKFAGGAALVRVAGSPAAGQYSATKGVYTFAAADAAASVLISYSFVPADIEQFCIELIAERYRYKDRIGQTSKSLGGQETTSFSLKDIPDHLRLLIQPYRRVLPC